MLLDSLLTSDLVLNRKSLIWIWQYTYFETSREYQTSGFIKCYRYYKISGCTAAEKMKIVIVKTNITTLSFIPDNWKEYILFKV